MGFLCLLDFDFYGYARSGKIGVNSTAVETVKKYIIFKKK